MKKLQKLFTLITLAVLSITMTSCGGGDGDDNGNGGSSPTLFRKYQCVTYVATDDNFAVDDSNNTFVFNANGTYSSGFGKLASGNWTTADPSLISQTYGYTPKYCFYFSPTSGTKYLVGIQQDSDSTMTLIVYDISGGSPVFLVSYVLI